MSEHRAKPPQETADERRARVYAARRDESLDDEQVRRLARKHLPWKDWILSDFLRYWFWLGVLAVTTFALMDLARVLHLRDAVGIATLAALFLTAVVLASMLYLRIWPRGIMTRFDRRR